MGDAERLQTLKRDVVCAGIKAVTGIDMPANPKRRFQDGAVASPRTRVSKAWCRRTFSRIWQERLKEAEALERRSGNEVSVCAAVIQNAEFRIQTPAFASLIDSIALFSNTGRRSGRSIHIAPTRPSGRRSATPAAPSPRRPSSFSRTRSVRFDA